MLNFFLLNVPDKVYRRETGGLLFFFSCLTLENDLMEYAFCKHIETKLFTQFPFYEISCSLYSNVVQNAGYSPSRSLEDKR